jgi:Zn-dependent M28 family amino/carboxypeptidase
VLCAACAPSRRPDLATLSCGTAVPTGAPPAEVAAALDRISGARARAAVDRLAAFGTRHTLSDATSPSRGIGAAREWIKRELQSAGVAASFDTHRQPPDGARIPREVEITNVVGEIPGARPEARARRYYLVAHYDARASDPLDAVSDAPGANDDGSGVAVLLETARALARTRPDATIVFLATAGEEQGLYGARLHARAAREQGLDIRGVLSNDIVGDPTSPSGPAQRDRVRVFSEGLVRDLSEPAASDARRQGRESEGPSRQLARFVAGVAAWQRTDVRPMLVLRADRTLRGGDHLAFCEAGFPAVRLTAVDEHYDRQHQDVRVEGGRRFGDLPEFVDAGYLAGVARLDAATLMHLADAPSPPAQARVVAVELGNDTLVRWAPSPEPDVAGYEVVWRATTCADWEGARDAGRKTELRLPMNKDNFFFGVRAYDRSGYRSPVSFAAAAKQ